MKSFFEEHFFTHWFTWQAAVSKLRIATPSMVRRSQACLVASTFSQTYSMNAVSEYMYGLRHNKESFLVLATVLMSTPKAKDKVQLKWKEKDRKEKYHDAPVKNTFPAIQNNR